MIILKHLLFCIQEVREIKLKQHSTHSEALREESLDCQSEAVQGDVDGWLHRESFKERCSFSHGTSLSTWLFILRYRLRAHRSSFSTGGQTHTHSLDKLQPASFLVCLPASHLFCSAIYGAPGVKILPLSSDIYVCLPAKHSNQRRAPPSISQ